MSDILTCRNCGHRWFKRVENPGRCPKCNYKYYDRPHPVKYVIGNKVRVVYV